MISFYIRSSFNPCQSSIAFLYRSQSFVLQWLVSIWNPALSWNGLIQQHNRRCFSSNDYKNNWINWQRIFSWSKKNSDKLDNKKETDKFQGNMNLRKRESKVHSENSHLQPDNMDLVSYGQWSTVNKMLLQLWNLQPKLYKLSI